MSNGSRGGNSAPSGQPVPTHTTQGVSDALRNAYRSVPADLPEDIKRLLAKLH